MLYGGLVDVFIAPSMTDALLLLMVVYFSFNVNNNGFNSVSLFMI